MRRHVLLCLFALTIARGVAAESQRAFLDLVVNDVDSGESLVLLRGSDAWVGVNALANAGLKGFAGRREQVSGQEFVSLASLAPDVTFAVDEVGLRLTLTVDPRLLGRTVRDLSIGPPAGLIFRRDTSGFVNYAVNWNSRNQVDLFTEAGATVKGALLYNTLSASGGSTTRGITSLVFDERDRMRRWTVGDSFASSGALGGDAWIAGLSFGRAFDLDPYYVRYPTMSVSTPIAVPSVLEVHVNGQVVHEEPVAPGRLDLTNIPMTLGRNDAQIVVRDAFGGTRELTSTYYLTTTALAPGVQDYQYSVGFRREGLGAESWDYRTPVALARHRIGLTDSLTAGGHAEFEPGRLLSAGPSLNIRLPFGEVEAAGSISRTPTGLGSAAFTAFNYTGRPVSAGGSLMLASRRYAPLTANPVGEDPATEASVFASASVAGPVSVTAQYTRTGLHQGIVRARTSVLSNVHLARDMELTASVTRTRDEHGPGREVYAGVTVLFGRDSSASVSHVNDAQGSRMAVDAQKPLPAGVGYGYQVHADSGPSDTVNGVARYQGDHGRYELRQDSVGGNVLTTVSVAGALVGIGGSVYATRPVQNSFALIRVPGVEGVRAFASHQEVGRTGKDGNLLVPDLQAYYGNILNIDDSDIPLQYAVSDTGLTLAPPYRGGAVAAFDVRRIQRVTGTIVVVDGHGEQAPSYGELTVTLDGTSATSPVGGEGEFYFENLPAGSHRAVVEKEGRRCQFTLVVPVSDALVVDLGTLRCTE
ncbi:MAG: fimbria/pilus outer membrane usher protein [Betaproteobacteria bacterium]